MPRSLNNGHYAIDTNNSFVDTGGVAEKICPTGHFCNGGHKTPCTEAGELCLEGAALPSPCPQGSYCSTTSSIDTCSSGHYCPAETVTPEKCPRGSYCPVGAFAASACPKGSYCPNRGSAIPTSLQVGHFAVDTNGNFVDTSGVDKKICPPGHFCSGGDKMPCTEAGTRLLNC